MKELFSALVQPITAINSGVGSPSFEIIFTITGDRHAWKLP
jgi:hypothetical protein